MDINNETKQTAVDIAFQKLANSGLLVTRDYKNIVAYREAKEMEKDKHERFNKFLNDEKELGISDLKTIERIQWYYNTYYNETYRGNK
jgi:hypothetical protein